MFMHPSTKLRTSPSLHTRLIDKSIVMALLTCLLIVGSASTSARIYLASLDAETVEASVEIASR